MGEIVKFKRERSQDVLFSKNEKLLKEVLSYINKSDLLKLGDLKATLEWDSERLMIELTQTHTKKDIQEITKGDWKVPYDLGILFSDPNANFLTYFEAVTDELSIYRDRYEEYVLEEQLKKRPNNIIQFKR